MPVPEAHEEGLEYGDNMADIAADNMLLCNVSRNDDERRFEDMVAAAKKFESRVLPQLGCYRGSVMDAIDDECDRERELQRVAQVAQPPAAKEGVMEMMFKYLQDKDAKDREVRALELAERERVSAEYREKERKVLVCVRVCVRVRVC